MAGSVQENTGKEDMSAPLNGSEASATLLNRHFTRAGRDPLALAPFEERLLLGRVTRVPSSWGPRGLIKLAKELKNQPASSYLVQAAIEHAETASEAGFLTEDERLTLVDELAWVLGRGMGWVGQDSGVWVGTVNLHHFCEPVTQRFDLAGLRQTCRCLLIAAAGRAAKEGRPHAYSLNWTNGAGFLVVSGIAYDSSRGVGILGSIAAMILGQSCLTLADLAGRKPELANPAAKQVVLGGLNNAKGRAADLPPTASIASSADSDRWQAQTQELLEEAVKAIEAKGTISPYPTSPQPCDENEEWLDPISTFAEAVPTLQLPDLASRPEMKSCLKAMGLNEQQKGAVLSALSSGESILAAGVPEAKAPSLKTALGAWSFHPNAQLNMGSAVSPFVAGALKHRIHLPAGIPEDFVSSVIGAASRFGLPGAIPFVQQTEGGDGAAAGVRTAEPMEDVPAEEKPDPAAADMEQPVEPVMEAPVMEAAVLPSTVAPEERAAVYESSASSHEDDKEPALQQQEAPISVEPVSPLPKDVMELKTPEASLSPQPGKEEQAGQEEIVSTPCPSADLIEEEQEGPGTPEESQAAVEPAPEAVVSEEVKADEPSQAEGPAPEVEESSDLPHEPALESAPEEVVSDEVKGEEPSLAEVPEPEAKEPAEVQLAATVKEALDAPATDEPASPETSQIEAAQSASDALKGDPVPLVMLGEDGSLPGALPEEPEPDAEPAMVEETQKPVEQGVQDDVSDPAAEATLQAGDAGTIVPVPSRVSLPEFDEPRVVLTPCAWSRSLKVASSSGEFTVHAAKEDASSPLFIGVTASSLPPLSRSLLDASLASINLGLSRGITVEEFRRAITEPSLMRDILAAVSKLVEEQ